MKAGAGGGGLVTGFFDVVLVEFVAANLEEMIKRRGVNEGGLTTPHTDLRGETFDQQPAGPRCRTPHLTLLDFRVGH